MQEILENDEESGVMAPPADPRAQPNSRAHSSPVAFDEGRLAFLLDLVDTPGPSGFEGPAVDRWLEEASTFASTRRDALGSGIATVNQGMSPRIALVGHLDEIGLIVTKIDERGLLRCANIGGWDTAVLVGQRVRVLTRMGVVHGTLGRRAIHLIEPDERKKAPKISDLWIDIAAESGEEARQMVRVGDPVVVDVLPRRIGRHRLVSRSLDNRIGAFVSLESARACLGAADAEVIAVGSVAEENGGAGAATAAFGASPDVAVVVDVTSTSDLPGTRVDHTIVMGAGPVIARGASTSTRVSEALIAVAERDGIPHQLRGMGRRTSTDADNVHSAGAGVATGLVSIPCRYLHTPCEQVDLRDVRAAIDLIAAWVRSGEGQSAGDGRSR